MNRITATLLCLMLCLAGTSLHVTAFAAEQTSVSAPSAPSPAAPVQVVALKTPLVPPASIRPFPAPVTTRTVTVPASIDATGTTDVSTALINFIRNVPDGSLINFPSTGIYRIDKCIYFAGRHNLIFDGNGCTLKYTSVTGTTEGYSLWYDYGGEEAGLGSDIWIRNFVLIGSSPYPGVFTPGTSPTGGEQQHGIVLGSDRFEVSDCTISAVWGDGFYMDWGPTDVWIHDNHVISAGRQGVAVCAGTNVTIERNAFDTVGLSAFCVEPNTSSESCTNIIFHNNTVGAYGTPALFTPYAFSVGDAAEATIDRVVVDGNIVTGGSIATDVNSIGAVRMTRITFTNNKGAVAAGPVLILKHIDGLTVTGNVQPLTSGVLTRITDCTGVTALTIAAPTVMLAITLPANGTVTRNPDLPSYPSGTVVTLTAIPAVGYIFSSWSGGLTGNANPVTITMNGNKTVSAIFTAVPTYTLTPSAGTRGTITRSTPPRHSSTAKSQDVTLVFVKP